MNDDEAILKDSAEEVIKLSIQLKTKSITPQEFVKSIARDVEALDNMYMPWLNDIPKTIAEIVRKSISLKEEDRYRNCIDMWLDLRNNLIKEDMENILPKI